MKQLIILLVVILMFSCESRKVKEVRETINSASELVESSSMDSWKSKALAYVNTEYSKGYVTDKERDLYIKTINKEYKNEFQFDYKKYLDSYTASGSPSDEIAEAFNFARKKYPNATKEILPGLVWLKLNNCLSELNSLSYSTLMEVRHLDDYFTETYYEGYYVIHEGKPYDLKLKEINGKVLNREQSIALRKKIESSKEYIKVSKVAEFKSFLNSGVYDKFILVDASGKELEYWEKPNVLVGNSAGKSKYWRKRATPFKYQIDQRFELTYINPKSYIKEIWNDSLGEKLYGDSVE